MKEELSKDKKAGDQIKEIDDIKDEVRDAIIEKWLTYMRVEQGSKWLTWRLWVIKRMFNKYDQSYLKLAMNQLRRDDDNMLKKRTEGNICVDQETYTHGLPRRDIIFPLLDPDLDEEQRLKAHKVWYKDFSYLEDWESEEQKTEFRLEGTP